MALTLKFGTSASARPALAAFSVAATPCLQSPGRQEGQPACVVTVGPAPRSAWPPYLRGHPPPPLLQKLPASYPTPFPRGGHAAWKEVRPGLSAVRSGLTATPPLGHLSASSISLGTPPPHPAPHHPASVLDQEGLEMRGVHPRRSLSIGHSGISPALSKTVIIPEGDAGTMDPTLSLEGGRTQAFVSWRGYSGTKTPALWQAGGHHRGLHAGRLQSTGNHPLPQSWGPHV